MANLRKVLVLLLDDISRELQRVASERNLTPAIDRLRGIGRTFRNHTAAHVCSASRAKFVSGFETWREENRIFGVFLGNEPGTKELPEHELSLGWATHSSTWLGKWHLADPNLLDHPHRLGWGHVDGSIRNLNAGGGDYSHWKRLHANEAGEWVESWCSDYATARTAADARHAVNAGRQLVVASFNACHKPFHYPAGMSGPEDDSFEMRLAMLAALDLELGSLLEQAFAGDYQVVFTVDNCGTKEDGGKGTLYQKSIGCDLILAGSTIAGRGVSDALTSNVDLHATIWTWLNGTPPAGTDGISLIGLAVPRQYAYCDQAHMKTGNLPAAWDRSVRGPRFKLIAYKWDHATLGRATEAWELFDLQRDPEEGTNRYGDHAYEQHQDALKEALISSFNSAPGGPTIVLRQGKP